MALFFSIFMGYVLEFTVYVILVNLSLSFSELENSFANWHVQGVFLVVGSVCDLLDIAQPELEARGAVDGTYIGYQYWNRMSDLHSRLQIALIFISLESEGKHETVGFSTEQQRANNEFAFL